MPSTKNYRTTPLNGRWVVKRQGSKHAVGVYPTQSEAWDEARRRALGSGGEAVLQGRDGKIRARNSYSDDPFPPTD
jgi:hypothetical protein